MRMRTKTDSGKEEMKRKKKDPGTGPTGEGGTGETARVSRNSNFGLTVC